MAEELLGGLLPRDAPLRERTLWAGLSALVGIIHDGNDEQAFKRVSVAAQTFGVHEDSLLKRFGFWYHRPSDAYVSKECWQEMMLVDAKQLPGASLH